MTAAIARSETIAAQSSKSSGEDRKTQIEALVHRIDHSEGHLRITLDLARLLDCDPGQAILASPIPVPVSLRRQGRNRPIVLHAENGVPRRDADLIALLADARRWMDDLLEGRATSVAVITEREQLRPGTVSRILPLAWLAPDITTAIYEGRQPANLTARALRDLPDLPLDWAVQRGLLGFPPA